MRFPINKPVRAALVFAVVLAVAIVVLAVAVRTLERGPKQPIPFSHRIHVATKEINCFFCHQFSTVSSQPGMPSVAKCVLCHQVIASRFPPINKIFYYYNQNQGIPWVRVNRLPDFVHFNHQIHLARGIDCSRCHGNVRQMDRVQVVNEFSMGFCTNCHDQYKASVDCYTCHW